MQIIVKLGEPLWRSAGQRRVKLEWPGAGSVAVADVLARLSADYPAFEPAFRGLGLAHGGAYRLFVDAVAVDLSAMPPGPALTDGQTLYILLPAIGG